MIAWKRQSMSLSAQHPSGIPSIGCVYFGGGDQNYTGRATCSKWDCSIVVTCRIEFFPNYFELLLALLAVNHLVHLFESLHQSLLIFLLFVRFQILQLGYKYLLHVLRHLNTYITNNIPPWPSNTPKIELPLPMSNYVIAASSIDLRQPMYLNELPCISHRANFSFSFAFSAFEDIFYLLGWAR